MKLSILSVFVTLFSLSLAQLSGSVGPLTVHTTKAVKKTCNVLSYGAKADQSTDLGPPLLAAFNACKSGGLVVIPTGNYALATWVTLSGGSAWALQLDGIIYRTGTSGGNMIFIEHTSDFEFFSSTGTGAVQANGYTFHQSGSLSGPRILRLYEVTNFSIHDLKLVDSPAFHFSMDTCSNGEIFNMLIRGGDHGGLDGIDVWSTNIHIHDIMVTNKDECVTVKSPSSNILIENIYCNDSGGCAFGSLGSDTAISNIVYRNIYTSLSNQMMMIKSNGGSGYVENVLLENFIGHKNAYSLDIDQYWSSMSTIAGAGVALSNITARNWKGTEANGAARGPIKVACADGAPCTGIDIQDFAMWTEAGSTQFYTCRSAYGNGFCLKPDISNPSSYAASTTTVSSAPSGYSAATMPYDLATGFGFTVSIPIPTVWPASYYPGAAMISPYPDGSGVAVVQAVSSVSSSATTTSSSSAWAAVASTSSSHAWLSVLAASTSISATTNSSSSSSTFHLSATNNFTTTKSTTILPSLTGSTTSPAATLTSSNSRTVSIPVSPMSSSSSSSSSFSNSTSLYSIHTSTSPVSFTSTFTTDLNAAPTKFVCYAEG